MRKKRIFAPYLDTSDMLLGVFLVLKLIGEIDWHWIWILSPLWAHWILVIAYNSKSEAKP